MRLLENEPLFQINDETSEVADGRIRVSYYIKIKILIKKNGIKKLKFIGLALSMNIQASLYLASLNLKGT